MDVRVSEEKFAVTRRGFLQTSAMAVAGLAQGFTPALGQGIGPAKAVIQLLLVGGPSQLDTWDPKPDAPSTIKNPRRPIATRIPGVYLDASFPRLAALADRFALLRSLTHQEAPIHETGLQLLQTGWLSAGEHAHPHLGAIASRLRPSADGLPSWVMTPFALGNTGVALSQGQETGWLGSNHAATLVSPRDSVSRWNESPKLRAAANLEKEAPASRARYGGDLLGQSCLLARRLVEAGVRVVTINAFASVFGQLSWDMHAQGNALPVTLEDYEHNLCPQLDRALGVLISDLINRGLANDVMVVASGEMGRAPHFNSRGGRDHWPGVWSALAFGGGVPGGIVVGSSDACAGAPRERPIVPAELVATMCHVLGIPSGLIATPSPNCHPLIPAAPIVEII